MATGHKFRADSCKIITPEYKAIHMRAETANLVDEIKQAIDLLRRYL
jgi:hypothetical protein